MRTGDKVYGNKFKGQFRTIYKVKAVHRDGTLTIKALWELNADGTENLDAGFLGFMYNNIKADSLSPSFEGATPNVGTPVAIAI